MRSFPFRWFCLLVVPGAFCVGLQACSEDDPSIPPGSDGGGFETSVPDSSLPDSAQSQDAPADGPKPCVAPSLVCQGACVDPMTDRLHCGARGNCEDPPVLDGGADADAGADADSGPSPNSAGVVCPPSDDCVDGACVEVRVPTFVSPGGFTTTYPHAKDITWALATVDASTVEYEVRYPADASVDAAVEAGVHRVQPPALLGLLPHGTEILFHAEYGPGGPGPEPTRSFVVQTDLAARRGHGALFHNFRLGDAGPIAIVAPGATVTGTVDWQSWNAPADGYCPACILVVGVSLEGTQGQCQPGHGRAVYPGRSGTIALTFTAPTTPGRYIVRGGGALAFSCPAGFPNGEPLGVIEVR